MPNIPDTRSDFQSSGSITGSAAPAEISLPSNSQALQPVVRSGGLYETWEMGQEAAGIFLLYGHPQILTLSQKLACQGLLQAENLIVLDGGNVFDPYLVSQLARKAGREPEDFLRRIRISRSFTCHQMLSLMRKVESASRRWKSPFILLLGPLTAFYDESVPNYEAWALFRSFQEELEHLNRVGFRLLLACQQPSATTKRTFVQQLKASARGIASCWEAEVPSGRQQELMASETNQRLPGTREMKSLLLIRMEKPAEPRRQWVIRTGEKLNPRSYLAL